MSEASRLGSGPPGRRVSPSVWAVGLGLAALGLFTLGFWARLIRLPHMLERGEVIAQAIVLWWRSGWLPYGQVSELPLVQNPYGPIYFWLCAPLGELWGSPYTAGRLLSAVSMVLALAVVGLWVYRRTSSRWAVWIAILLPLTAKPILFFSPLYRVDSLGLLFSIVGFAVLTSSRSRAAVALAMVAFVLAFSTKMTYVVGPAAAFLYLWPRDRRRALWLAGGLAVAFAGQVGLMELATDGAYLHNVRWGNAPVDLSKSGNLVVRSLLSLFWIVALIGFVRRQPGRRLRSLVTAPYVLLSYVVGILLALNPYASWNYLMEFYLALGLMTGEVLGGGLDDVVGGKLRPSSAMRWLLVHVVISWLLVARWSVDQEERLSEHRDRYEHALHQLSSEMQTLGHEHITVLDSDAGRDALNGLGARNPVVMMKALEEAPSTQDVLEKALREGELRRIYQGDCCPFRNWRRAQP